MFRGGKNACQRLFRRGGYMRRRRGAQDGGHEHIGDDQEWHESDQIGALSGLRKTLQRRGTLIAVADNVHRLK